MTKYYKKCHIIGLFQVQENLLCNSLPLGAQETTYPSPALQTAAPPHPVGTSLARSLRRPVIFARTRLLSSKEII